MATIVDKKPNVDPSLDPVRSRSKVPFSAHLAGTYRFGEYSPHFVMEGVNNDKIPFRSSHQVRSYTLKAPLMNNISMKKDYFEVPMEAILPLNWDKIYTNPVQGDDVNANFANCVIRFGSDDMHLMFGSLGSYLNALYLEDSESGDYSRFLTFYLKYWIFLERWFSDGSLVSALVEHLSKCFNFSAFDAQTLSECGLQNGSSFDNLFDIVIAGFSSFVYDVVPEVAFGDGSEYYYIVLDYSDNGYNPNEVADHPLISIRDFLMKIRDDNDWYFMNGITSLVLTPILPNGSASPIKDGSVFNLNLSRPIAYQLCCAQFYSNDKIDYIYSAELWRENLKSVWYEIVDSLGDAISAFRNPKFTYNGIECDYDICSGQIFAQMFSLNEWQSDHTNMNLDAWLDFWRLILGFNRSLRFIDYFTGAKSQPLAVGDVNVSVSDSSVNVVDITRNIQRQRFLNFVNRVGRKFEAYVSELTGHSVAPDYHNPLFLSHTSDDIYTVENENTGSAQFSEQNSVSSVFMSNASRFGFEATIDRPCIIIGITYFDISRYYSHNIERQNFHVDRYDMFNPFMQFVGDQPIYRGELTGYHGESLYFGYALRHLEYKTRVNSCFGGFANGSLPGWQFIADEDRPIDDIETIGPEYIRSRQSELDRFYVSLTGYSLGTYFHFIIDNFNDCEPSRPMVYAPTIL